MCAPPVGGFRRAGVACRRCTACCAFDTSRCPRWLDCVTNRRVAGYAGVIIRLRRGRRQNRRATGYATRCASATYAACSNSGLWRAVRIIGHRRADSAHCARRANRTCSIRALWRRWWRDWSRRCSCHRRRRARTATGIATRLHRRARRWLCGSETRRRWRCDIRAARLGKRAKQGKSNSTNKKKTAHDGRYCFGVKVCFQRQLLEHHLQQLWHL